MVVAALWLPSALFRVSLGDGEAGKELCQAQVRVAAKNSPPQPGVVVHTCNPRQED
jgi:hypothetical protein